jgi:hypothetical protein
MQVDSQGRGLEHYARDSWRMTEQEKVINSYFYSYLNFVLVSQYFLLNLC